MGTLLLSTLKLLFLHLISSSHDVNSQYLGRQQKVRSEEGGWKATISCLFVARFTLEHDNLEDESPGITRKGFEGSSIPVAD